MDTRDYLDEMNRIDGQLQAMVKNTSKSLMAVLEALPSYSLKVPTDDFTHKIYEARLKQASSAVLESVGKDTFRTCITQYIELMDEALIMISSHDLLKEIEINAIAMKELGDYIKKNKEEKEEGDRNGKEENEREKEVENEEVDRREVNKVENEKIRWGGHFYFLDRMRETAIKRQLKSLELLLGVNKSVRGHFRRSKGTN